MRSGPDRAARLGPARSQAAKACPDVGPYVKAALDLRDDDDKLRALDPEVKLAARGEVADGRRTEDDVVLTLQVRHALPGMRDIGRRDQLR